MNRPAGLSATVMTAEEREKDRQARARAWAEENAEAIAQHAAWIEANGMPLARWQVLKVD